MTSDRRAPPGAPPRAGPSQSESKEVGMPLPANVDSVQAALNAVIDYLIEGEEKHFIEAGAPENHIYRAVYHLARHAARKELKLFLDPDDKEAVADRIR